MSFNPRARDGRELNLSRARHTRQRFNPRARDGREVLLNLLKQEAKVSIHAPVMDAKKQTIDNNAFNFVSIHAPVMDAN